MKNKAAAEIVVRGYRNFESSERGCDTEETHIDTIREAVIRAKYFLTEEYRRASECSYRLTYAEVVVNGKVIHDFFG